MEIIWMYFAGILHWHYDNYMVITMLVNWSSRILILVLPEPSKKPRKHDSYYSYISRRNSLDQQWYVYFFCKICIICHRRQWVNLSCSITETISTDVGNGHDYVVGIILSSDESRVTVISIRLYWHFTSALDNGLQFLYKNFHYTNSNE